MRAVMMVPKLLHATCFTKTIHHSWQGVLLLLHDNCSWVWIAAVLVSSLSKLVTQNVYTVLGVNGTS